MTKLGRFKLCTKQWSRDGLTSVSVLTTQADTQSAGHRAFRLACIRTLVLFSVAPPGIQGGFASRPRSDHDGQSRQPRRNEVRQIVQSGSRLAKVEIALVGMANHGIERIN